VAVNRRACSTRRSGSSVLDRRLLDLLEHHGVPFCVIGGVALAVHGHARYTADVDLLTMDRRVLDPAFWAGAGARFKREKSRIACHLHLC
jgi:hypothetical protein